MHIKHLLPLGVSMALVASAALPTRAGEAASISHDELLKAISTKSVVLLDVNGTDSYKEGHIPGALNFEAVMANLKTQLPANKAALIVAYCGGEKCMAYKQGAEAASKLGYTNVRHYAPGISGWKKAGAPVAKG